MPKFLRLGFQAWLRLFFAIGLAVAVAACGGNGDNDDDMGGDTADTITGTAAIGVPIDGVIIVTDIFGTTAEAEIAEDGNYEVDVTGMTGPFVIAAVPNDAAEPTQYSWASQANITVNVTPITTLALYSATENGDLDSIANNWASEFNGISQSDIDDAVDTILANLQDELMDAGVDGNFDPFSSIFDADGAGFDGFLDDFAVDYDVGTGFTITIDDIEFDFDPDIDIGIGSGDFSTAMLSGNATGDLGFTSWTPDTYSEFVAGDVASYSWSSSNGTTEYSLTVFLEPITGGAVNFTQTTGTQGNLQFVTWYRDGISGITIGDQVIDIDVTMQLVENEPVTTLNFDAEFERITDE